MKESNPFVHPVYGCDTCHDFGMVAGKWADEPCPHCAGISKEERERKRVARYVASLRPPTITVLDLTADELELFRRWKAQFHVYSTATLLSWIEGRRYDPRKDPEFKREGKAAFFEWRQRRGNMGPDPEWLRDPFGKELCRWQRAVLEARKGEGVDSPP